jgi:hypothetical protein
MKRRRSARSHRIILSIAIAWLLGLASERGSAQQPPTTLDDLDAGTAGATTARDALDDAARRQDGGSEDDHIEAASGLDRSIKSVRSLQERYPVASDNEKRWLLDQLVAVVERMEGRVAEATALLAELKTTGADTLRDLSPAGQVVIGTLVLLARMSVLRAGVREQLESARARRDLVRTLCLNDKLNQMDVGVLSARERLAQLELAAQRLDTELARHEFTILSVLEQRADQLSAEANRCIGEGMSLVGEGAVTSTSSPWLPEPFGDEAWVDLVTEVPSCTSCIR